MRHFQIQAPVLCCHSYGVPIGLEWAQRHPVSALVLICGGTHNLAPWWEMPLMRGLRWGGRHLYRLPGVQQFTDRLISTHTHDTIQQFLAESTVPLEPHPYEALEIFWGYDFFAHRKNRRLQKVPILVVSGGQDPTFTVEMGTALASHFAKGQHLQIEGAGHIVMAEYSDVVDDAIAQLINML
ncbi:MAG: alpha/beta hydrolase [Thermosynechococcaceae cyanobacterium]